MKSRSILTAPRGTRAVRTEEERITRYIPKLCSKKQGIRRLVNYVVYRYEVPQSKVGTLLLMLKDQGRIVIQDSHVIAACRR